MYVPAHIKQLDGSPCASTNCWAAVTAWLIRAGTLGRRRMTPSDARVLARAHGCRTGGLGDMATALERVRVEYRMRVDVDREHARELLGRPGAVLGIPTDYERLPLEDRHDATVDYYHMLGVVGGADGRGRVRVMDPLGSRLEWLELAHVIEAGIGYGREHGDGRTLDAVVVPVPEPADR